VTAFRFSSSNVAPNQARDLLWEHTIHQVISLLQEAERRIRAPEGQTRYAALKGWWRPSKALLPKRGHVRIPAETALSEAIVDEIESLREDIILKVAPAPADLFDINGLQFSLEAPRRRKKGLGKHAKPTDIRVYRLGSEIIDLRIEAKVLIKDGDLQKFYLSAQGLKRFSDPDEPYTEHEIGGMLAYTVTDYRSAWVTKIDNALCASFPPIPTFKQRIYTSPDETLFCRVPYSPQKGTRTDVLVFHLVLEFDSDPPAR
jgi:hypothetical protein